MKVTLCELEKDMWDKLQTIYEGDEKVKEAEIQTYREQFEGPQMEEDENVATYFLRVNEVVMFSRGLGETLEYSIVVKKVLRSIPDRYDPKVLAIEELRELKTMKMDELQGILTTYEMRKEQDKTSKYEVVFKSLGRENSHKTSDSS